MADILVEIDGVRQMMEESLLEKTEGSVDNDDEYTTWIEWRLNGTIVKRSVHVRLKKNLAADAIAGLFNS